MYNLSRLLFGAAFVAVSGGAALAQEPVVATYNHTTISIGGGVQLLQLPDIRYTFLSSTQDGRALRKQKNDDFDDYGGVASGAIETPLGFWGATPVTGVVSGFFANVEDGDRRSCVSRGSALCTVEDIVDNPNRPDSFVADRFVTKTDRDVDFWGVGAEARFGKAPAPVPDAGGYLFRLGYAGIGADVRGIDQDIRLRLDASGAAINPSARLNETLDTTYWGGFLSVGGEYNILGYLGVGKGWGLRSLLSLRAGIYNADTDYSGLFRRTSIERATRLGLSDDEVAFIGGVSFETRKQFGPRSSLSLVTDYEYFSYAPEMRYVDADRSGCGPAPLVNCPGNVTRTHIDDDDAFAVRTMLRLNVGLGSAPLYAEPMK